jgi:hypothetical protein
MNKLAEEICPEQSKFENGMAQILQGHQLKLKNVCYCKFDEKTSLMVLSDNSSSTIEYLENPAFSIHF